MIIDLILGIEDNCIEIYIEIVENINISDSENSINL